MVADNPKREMKQMNQEIVFIPLGGGQRVGGSCYYLQLGGANVILDAGIGIENGIEFVPDFHTLITSPFMQSMNQINQVFISHAHLDHVGYLFQLMSQARHAATYMTEITKTLAEYQLYDRFFVGGSGSDEDKRLAARNLLDQIASVSFMQTMDFGSYQVTFYPAGHIPGAMMMLFRIGRRTILYTGDYSLNHTALTQGCTLPENLRIDIVILCGLHAKHPDYVKRSDELFRQAHYALRSVEVYRQSITCRIPQLSKGIEFLKTLNNWNTAGIPIYLDGSVMDIVRKMERTSVPVLNQYNRLMGDMPPAEPYIYLTSEQNSCWEKTDRSIRVDFSLHEDFSEMKRFLKRINPKQAVVVHCEKERDRYGHTIEQEMMLDGESRTQFIFAEEKESYLL